MDQKVIKPAAEGKLANAGVPTQVANPSRAGWRTFFQSAIIIIPALNIALANFQVLLETPPLDTLAPEWAFVAVNFTGLVMAALTKVIAQIMALPGFNAWISRRAPFLAPMGRSTETLAPIKQAPKTAGYTD